MSSVLQRAGAQQVTPHSSESAFSTTGANEDSAITDPIGDKIVHTDLDKFSSPPAASSFHRTIEGNLNSSIRNTPKIWQEISKFPRHSARHDSGPENIRFNKNENALLAQAKSERASHCSVFRNMWPEDELEMRTPVFTNSCGEILRMAEPLREIFRGKTRHNVEKTQSL